MKKTLHIDSAPDGIRLTMVVTAGSASNTRRDQLATFGNGYGLGNLQARMMMAALALIDDMTADDVWIDLNERDTATIVRIGKLMDNPIGFQAQLITAVSGGF